MVDISTLHHTTTERNIMEKYYAMTQLLTFSQLIHGARLMQVQTA